MKIERKELVFAVIAIFLGVITRTIFDLGENVELITGFAIASGYFFKNKRYAYAVPLISMIVSDLFIKNSSIFVFTWTGFLFAPMLGSLLRSLSNKFKNTKLSFGLVGSQSFGIVGTLFFFLWTNLGVWLIGEMYIKDVQGLALSYINAVPFLINQLVGNLVIVPIIFVLGAIVFEYDRFINPIENKSIE